MKKSTVKSQSKLRARSRTASQELVKSLSKAFPDKKIPIAVLTGLSKKYAKRPIDPSSSFVRRFAVDAKDTKNINATKFTEYLSQNTHTQRGQPLSDEAIKRAHAAFCNEQGKMTFQYIMKKCQQLGVPMTEKVAKGIVRKFGKRKDHLTVQDCTKVIHRRNANANAKPRSNTPKKNIRNTSSISAGKR